MDELTHTIEPDDHGKGWHVTEWGDSDRTVVFTGTQEECERYVRQHAAMDELVRLTEELGLYED